VNAAIAKRTLRWRRLETPLETAIRARRIEIAQLLIERGANVNARNPKGETLLHLAVRINDPNLVKMLLAAGAYPTARSRDELTPAHLARKLDRKSGKRAEIIALLREAEAKALKEEPPIVPVAPPTPTPE
jgi:cytohesin